MTLRMWLRLANQCCDRHSSRKRLLKLSMYVLHGLAGLDEAQLAAVVRGPCVHDPAGELRPVVGPDDAGQAAF
jgi:hypothetical protein